MRRKKIMIIDHCGKCCFSWYDSYKNQYYCVEENVDCKLIGKLGSIPKWCPLPDYEEEERC